MHCINLKRHFVILSLNNFFIEIFAYWFKNKGKEQSIVGKREYGIILKGLNRNRVYLLSLLIVEPMTLKKRGKKQHTAKREWEE